MLIIPPHSNFCLSSSKKICNDYEIQDFEIADTTNKTSQAMLEFNLQCACTQLISSSCPRYTYCWFSKLSNDYLPLLSEQKGRQDSECKLWHSLVVSCDSTIYKTNMNARGQWREGNFGTFEMPRQATYSRNVELLFFFLFLFFFIFSFFFFCFFFEHNNWYCGCTTYWGTECGRNHWLDAMQSFRKVSTIDCASFSHATDPETIAYYF